MIPYGRQTISQADIDAVAEVLRSPFLTQGPAVPRFEQAVAGTVGVNHAVAVNSATSALHVACLALGLGPGKLLWTVPNTFVASANCARYCGAEVDFVDIDPVTWNLSIPALERKLEAARAAGRLPDVLVPVHLTGQPTQQERIWALAQREGFKVLEDASHSIGATRNGEAVGSCRWSDITVFSFHPVKIITSGEGGMALTRSAELAERMRLFRSHGITRDPARFVVGGSGSAAAPDGVAAGSGSAAAPDGVAAGSNAAAAPDSAAAAASWYYEQQVLGMNYRMTDIQAALGTSQLERLQANVGRRNELAGRYNCALRDLPLRLPVVEESNRSAFHLYVIRLPGDDAARHRRVFDRLRGSGVGVNLHYHPVHLQPYYRALGFRAGQFPESEAYGRSAITLPLFPGLSDPEQDQVVEHLRRTLESEP